MAIGDKGNYLYDELLPAARRFKAAKNLPEVAIQTISRGRKNRILFAGLAKAKLKILNTEWEEYCRQEGLFNDTSLVY